MLKRIFGDAAQRVVTPLGAAVGRAGVTPNMISVIGFGITLVTAVLIAQGRFLLGGVILVAGSLFDMLDGAVARASGGGSKRGAFLDSTLDRLSDGAIFLGAVWWFSHIDNQLGMSLALGSMVLGFMVSYVRARAEGLGFTCRVGVAERPERIVVLAAGLLFNLLIPALGLLVFASALTLAQRCAHVWKQAA